MISDMSQVDENDVSQFAVRSKKKVRLIDFTMNQPANQPANQPTNQTSEVTSNGQFAEDEQSTNQNSSAKAIKQKNNSYVHPNRNEKQIKYDHLTLITQGLAPPSGMMTPPSVCNGTLAFPATVDSVRPVDVPPTLF